MSRTILVVDDEPNIRELCRLYLEQEGFAVEEAVDGNTAIAQAEAIKPDLIVLDVMMPGKSGFEICKELAPKGIPVLLLTARSDELDRILGLELGADDYLTKPFSPRELVARVKAILRREERVQAKAEGATAPPSGRTV
jgi:two-component system alkaline phosphatase synthesis response regulator PhoP